MNTFAIINMACNEFKLDEDAKRAMYVRVTGVSSLRTMSERQRIAVVEEVKRLGFKVRPGKKTDSRLDKIRPNANRPHCRLIHALWSSCVRLGVLDDGSIKAKNAFCKRFVAAGNAKVSVDVDFLSKEQADPIISALRAMENRGKAARQ